MVQGPAEGNPPTDFRDGSLQGAYFMLTARSFGFDCDSCPVSSPLSTKLNFSRWKNKIEFHLRYR